MERYDHFAYMAHLKGQLPEIKSFVASSDWTHLTQLLANLNTLIPPALVADYDFATQVVDRGADNLLLRTRYSALVLHRAAPGNASQAHDALRAARAIADRIVAHLVRDKRQGRHGLAHLEIPSVQFQTVSPVGDHVLGMGISYAIVSPLPLHPNPA